jgi:hypothetical protein
MTLGLMEPPGEPTCGGLTSWEIHSLWFGFLSAWGRFHPAQCSAEERSHLSEKRAYFWAGEAVGAVVQGLAEAGVIYLLTGDLGGAVASALVLVAGRTAVSNTPAP